MEFPDRKFDIICDYSRFNRRLNLGSNIRVLKLGYSFNQQIVLTPNSVNHITIGGNFNLPLVNVPSCIKKIAVENSDYKYKHMIQDKI